jgi:hypothetical protein
MQAGELEMTPAAPALRLYKANDFIRLLAPIDLHPADPAECAAGRALAADKISPHVASAETFVRAQTRTGAAVFVQTSHGEVTGVTGMLALNADGLREIVEHRFTSKDPPDELLCTSGENVAAMYAWGFASSTRKAAAAVVMMTMVLRDNYPEIPFFTRAVTPAGVKVICGRMGYSPYPGAPDDLLWNPARSIEERAA